MDLLRRVRNRGQGQQLATAAASSNTALSLRTEPARLSAFSELYPPLQKLCAQLSQPDGLTSRMVLLQRPVKRMAELLRNLLEVLSAEAEAEPPGHTGPCLERVLQEAALEAVAQACLPDHPQGIRAVWLDFFADLLGRVRRPLLIHTEVLQPLHLTLKHCHRARRNALAAEGGKAGAGTGGAGDGAKGASAASSPAQTPKKRGYANLFTSSGGSAAEREGKGRGKLSAPPLTDNDRLLLVTLLANVCSHAANDPSLLALLLVQHPKPACPVATALLPFLHEGGALGAKAQEGLVQLCELAYNDEGLCRFLLKYSGLCEQVGLSLGALYAGIPNALPKTKHAWRLGASGLAERTPGLAAFLGLLDFCETLLQSSPEVIAEAVVEGVWRAFLHPVLLPALHQRRAADAAASTSYYNIFLLRVRHPLLLHAFLRLVLSDRTDSVPTLALLTRRMDALGDLGFVTLRLFHTLLDLHCEDAMLALCLRHLGRASARRQRLRGAVRSSAASSSADTPAVEVFPPATAADAAPAIEPGEITAQQYRAMLKTEQQQWCTWGMAMEGSRWLLQLRPRLAADSPSGRHFADCVIAARCTMSRARAACGVWTNSYTLSDAARAFGVRGKGECDGPAEGATPRDEAGGSESVRVADNGDSGVEATADPGPGIDPEELDALFLTKLATMLQRMPGSSVQTNLLLTDIVQQLASYPHPLVRAFVFGAPGTSLDSLRVVATEAEAASEAANAGTNDEPDGAAADAAPLGSTPATTTAISSTLGDAPTCLLGTVARIQAQLRREEVSFPTLQEELAAYRSDAAGYFKQADDSKKKQKKAKKNSGRAADRSSGQGNAAHGSPSVVFHRRGTNVSNLSEDPSYILDVSGWESQGDISVIGSLPGTPARSMGAANSTPGRTVDSGAPSVLAQSERSERSVRSGASSTAALSSPADDEDPANPQPALTQRALAEHEAREADGSSQPADDDASQHSGGAQDAQAAAKANSKEVRKFALKVLIFEEFLKELAALGLEHALLSVEPLLLPELVEDEEDAGSLNEAGEA